MLNLFTEIPPPPPRPFAPSFYLARFRTARLQEKAPSFPQTSGSPHGLWADLAGLGDTE